jgi:hypothetical protein
MSQHQKARECPHINVSVMLRIFYFPSTKYSIKNITDPNYAFVLIIVYRWSVRTVESKSYLREYNVVGVRWCRYSCNC